MPEGCRGYLQGGRRHREDVVGRQRRAAHRHRGGGPGFPHRLEPGGGGGAGHQARAGVRGPVGHGRHPLRRVHQRQQLDDGHGPGDPEGRPGRKEAVAEGRRQGHG